MIKFTLVGLTTPSQVIHIITIKINYVIIRRRFSVFVPQFGVSSWRSYVEQNKKDSKIKANKPRGMKFYLWSELNG
jgi:hypothetical protein